MEHKRLKNKFRPQKISEMDVVERQEEESTEANDDSDDTRIPKLKPRKVVRGKFAHRQGIPKCSIKRRRISVVFRG